MFKKSSVIFLCAVFLISAFMTSINANTSYALDRSSLITKTITLITSEPNFAIDGAYHELEEGLLTKVITENGTVLSPLRDIFYAIGETYKYDEATQTITMSIDDDTLVMYVGKTNALINGKEIQSQIAPRIINGSVFLPIRFVFESFGCPVKWESNRSRIVIPVIMKANAENVGPAKGGPVTFSTLLTQPADWYGSSESQKVADVVMGFQNPDGGWIKLQPDVDMTKPITGPGDLNVRVQSTIDNDSTFTEMKFLAKMYNATKNEKYKESFDKALDYILNGQYDNGGWPQFLTDPVGYQKNITFNDNAMVNIMTIIRDIMTNKDNLYSFVDSERVDRCKTAFDKGVNLILKSQIVVNGKKTAWCAQIDKDTLQPATGRSYELPSISGQESVGIVRFLMSIDNPSPAIIDAIQSAVAWFNEVKISGIKVVTKVDPTMEFGGDRIVVKDPNAPLLWARFYEIGTNRPIFASRDGVVKYNLADISYERRMKYSWYTSAPQSLLTKDYPQWQAKWAPNNNVLAKD